MTRTGRRLGGASIPTAESSDREDGRGREEDGTGGGSPSSLRSLKNLPSRGNLVATLVGLIPRSATSSMNVTLVSAQGSKPRVDLGDSDFVVAESVVAALAEERGGKRNKSKGRGGRGGSGSEKKRRKVEEKRITTPSGSVSGRSAKRNRVSGDKDGEEEGEEDDDDEDEEEPEGENE